VGPGAAVPDVADGLGAHLPAGAGDHRRVETLEPPPISEKELD
jgi:hypothetical protein